MAKVTVVYTATFKQTIDWPDDELGDLTYENVEINLDPIDAVFTGELDIDDVKLNGENYEF